MTQAQAGDREDATSANGFYGGVSYRDNSPSGIGVNFGTGGVALNRQPTAIVDEGASRALVFGGYRWHNDLAVEASVASLDQYALRPLDTVAAPQRGVGLQFGPGTGDLQSRIWNVDLFTSWTVYKAVALYGRLGYAQAETPVVTAPSSASVAGIKGLRDGMNYGVGVRYDMNSALGLRLEYSRFGRFAGEFGNGLPDSDQVTLGVRLRF